MQRRSGHILVAAGREPDNALAALCDHLRFGGEDLAGLGILCASPIRPDLGRQVAKIERRQFRQRQIEKRNPGRSLGCDVESRQNQQLARPRGGDIPETDALAVELGLLCVACRLITRRFHAEHRTIEPAGGTVGDSVLRRHDLRHRVDRDDDRPFQPFGGMHGVERNRLFLSIGAAFDGAGFVGPRSSHRFCESAQAADGIGAAEA